MHTPTPTPSPRSLGPHLSADRAPGLLLQPLLQAHSMEGVAAQGEGGAQLLRPRWSPLPVQLRWAALHEFQAHHAVLLLGMAWVTSKDRHLKSTAPELTAPLGAVAAAVAAAGLPRAAPRAAGLQVVAWGRGTAVVRSAAGQTGAAGCTVRALMLGV